MAGQGKKSAEEIIRDESAKNEAVKVVRTLERAVLSGDIEKVRKFYQEHDSVDFSGKALGLACRYGSPEIVEELLVHGASFSKGGSRWPNAYETRTYELFLLPAYTSKINYKTPLNLTAPQRVEVVRILHRNKAGNLGELLYYAILLGDHTVADELLSLGVDLPTWRAQMVDGTSGFEDPASGVTKSERGFFRRCVSNASDAELKEMITRFTKCPSVDKVALYRLDFYTYGGDLIERFLSDDMYQFILEKTNIRKIVRRQDMVECFIQSGNVGAIRYLLDNGFLNRKSQIEMLLKVIRKSAGGSPELQTMVLEYQAEQEKKKPASAKKALSLEGDPYAAGFLRQYWNYETCEDGKTVRITRYKGSSTDVVVPPRIGRRQVTQIASDAFTMPEPKGGKYARASRYVIRGPVCDIESITFPGTLRKIPSDILSACARSVKEIVIEEGVKQIDRNAFRGCRMRSIEIPESVESIGARAFWNCPDLAEAVLPDTLTGLPKQAFQGCSSLVSVKGGQGLKRIGESAFSGTGLLEAFVPPGVESMGTSVFEDCKHIRSAVIEAPLSRIPDHIFRRCRMLSEMQLPETLTCIGASAFEDSGLEKVEIPENIRNVQAWAFAGCRKLKEVRLLSGTVRLGKESFKGCSALEKAEIPDGPVVIGKEAFAQTGLTEISVPGREACIGVCAFAKCDRLVKAELFSTTVSDAVFERCSRLEDVQLSDEATEIPPRMFSGCKNLESFEIPRNVEKIAENAFADSGLHEVRIPDTVTFVDKEAFARCSALQKAVFEGSPQCGVALFKGCAKLEKTEITHFEDVPAEMFAGCRKLVFLELPGALQTIGMGAFSETGLRKIQIPANTLSIGEGAFAQCADLVCVAVSDGPHSGARLSEISSRAFRGCTALEKVQLPVSICEIGDSAFSHTGLREVHFSGALRVIGSKAFSSCEKLESVTFAKGDGGEEAGLEIRDEAFGTTPMLRRMEFPGRLESLGARAFQRSGLTKVTIPGGVSRIGQDAFRDASDLEAACFAAPGLLAVPENIFFGCSSLHTVKFEGNPERICSGAFAGTGIEEMRIPASVSCIESVAFKDCRKLRSVWIEGHALIGQGAFRGCRQLCEITFQSGIEKIPEAAFRDCTRLETLTIADTVRSIGDYAFQNAGLTSIRLPEGLERIGRNAFRGCRRLAEAEIPGHPDIEMGAFLGCSSLADEDGYIVVNGVLYGIKDDQRILSFTKDGKSIWPDPKLRADQDLEALSLPRTVTRIDQSVVLPEIVYKKPADSPEPPAVVALTQDARVSFGRFPQDSSLELQPIEWIDLGDVEHGALLVSRHPLFFVRRGAAGGEYGNPESSRLFNVLNGTFLETAFTPEERMCLQNVSDDPDHPALVRLLTLEEVNVYRRPLGQLRTAATGYAQAQCYRVAVKRKRDPQCWLVLPEKSGKFSAVDGRNGKIRMHPSTNCGYIRPVISLRIDAYAYVAREEEGASSVHSADRGRLRHDED